MVKRPGTLCHRADLGLLLGGATGCWTSKALALPSSPALIGATSPQDVHGHELIAHYATLELLPLGSIPRGFAKRLEAGWFCPEGARPGLPANTETSLPQSLHRVLVRFRLGCWELEFNRPNDRERAMRTCKLCACGTV